FWGAILVLLGLTLIINVVFKVNVPFFRIFLGLVIIYFGIRVISGGSFRRYAHRTSNDNTVIFGNNYAKASGSNQYNTVFGSQTVDLSDLDSTAHDIDVNAIFGEIKVYISKDQNVSAKLSAAFGSAVSPDYNQVSFGDLNYRSANFDALKPVLNI